MPSLTTITLDHLVQLKAEARGFSFQQRQPVGSLLAGRHASRLRGRGLAFEELRNYHPGDDIRTIDWKATARLRKPHVRVYSEERERPVLLVVDQRSPMFFGSRRTMKSVAAAELAALSAWRALNGGDRIGGIVFNEEELTTLRPQRGPAQALRLFHEIERYNQRLAEPEFPTGDVTLNHALQAALHSATHDHLVVLITDLDGADEETKRLTTRISAHNDLIVTAVYDPLGIQLTGHTDMEARDRGRNWKIPTDKAFDKAFRDTFEALTRQWRELFLHLRIPLFPLSTDQPVIDQIRKSFGQNPSR
ncbi:DUF58 domain-containing protein [Haloferula chungangensis]|uniref:DUF58 domain-containing protein n=1 Tax=Haloferula chungangensis TaxID=1048331 RepID=A0ABW2L8R1_9BACT